MEHWDVISEPRDSRSYKSKSSIATKVDLPNHHSSIARGYTLHHPAWPQSCLDASLLRLEATDRGDGRHYLINRSHGLPDIRLVAS